MKETCPHSWSLSGMCNSMWHSMKPIQWHSVWDINNRSSC